MRYFIGYLIKGEAKEYHERLVRKICGKFDVRNLNKHVPAHFTLKAPFETEDVSEVETVIEKFCENRSALDIKINGIGSFDEYIVFLDGTPSSESEKGFKELIGKLQEIDWMQSLEYEFTEVNFHATLARARDKKQFADIMEFLKEEEPSFDVKFDNVAIFRKGEDGWGVYREFGFGS